MKKLILICIVVGLCQNLAWSQAAKRTTTPKVNNRSTLRNQINEATKSNTPASEPTATTNTTPAAANSTPVNQTTEPIRNTSPVRIEEPKATGTSAVNTQNTPNTQKIPASTKKVIDGVTSFRPSEEGRKMIPLIEHRPEDIIWNRRVWRRIPLQERINRSLYFPVHEDKNRKSLTQTLVQGIADGTLKAYDPDIDDQFSTELNFSKVLERADALDKTTTRKSLQTGKDTSFIVKGTFPYSDIKELLIKEDWFFDKHYSRLFIRIVGICPIRVYNKTNNAEGAEDESDVLKKQLFWINYDQARPLLAQQKMFLEGNDRTGYSFDDLFLQRRFSSYIIKESSENVSTSIQDYIKNEYQQMLEGERIQNKLLNFEQDLWEY
jgi:gliding motility associated protien GldN